MTDRPVTLTKGTTSRHFAVGTGNTVTFEHIIFDGSGTGGGLSTAAGQLIIKDGTVIKNCYQDVGGGIYVNPQGMLRMEGGRITGNSVHNNRGGGVFVDGNTTRAGRFTMTGGSIDMNSAPLTNNTTSTSNGGGGVFLRINATFIFEGGDITGNTAGIRGGGICAETNTNIQMSGGSIEGNQVTNVADFSGGGGIYMNNGSFHMSNGTITNNTVKGTGNYSGDGGICFDMTSGNYDVLIEGGLIAQNNVEIAGNYSGGGGIRTNLRGGRGTCVIRGGRITSNSTNSCGGGIYQYGGMVEITETSVIDNNVAWTHGGGIYVLARGTLTMSGGEVTNNQAVTEGGGVYVYEGTFLMKENGTIDGNRAYHGGGIATHPSGMFQMSGGEITNNRASNDGGGAYIGEKFDFIDGTIANNHGGNGGGIYLVTSAQLNFSGGNLMGNHATANGGGIYSWGNIFMSGGTIANNHAAGEVGGGVMFNGQNNKSFTLKGGLIEKNSSPVSGGGIHVHRGSLAMEGATIGENTSANGAGIYIRTEGTMTMDDGLIHMNEAKETGGGIHVFGDLTMTGGEVSANKAGTQNGNVFEHGDGGGVYVGGRFDLDGGVISGNHTRYGGGIYVLSNGHLTLNNGNITGNWVSERGGGLFLHGRCTMLNGTFDGNSAAHGGAIAMSAQASASLRITNGRFHSNAAARGVGGGDGGAIYTEDNQYTRLTVGSNVQFSNNHASNGLFQLAANEGTARYPNIQAAGTTTGGHPINNLDISTSTYRITLYHVTSAGAEIEDHPATEVVRRISEAIFTREFPQINSYTPWQFRWGSDLTTFESATRGDGLTATLMDWPANDPWGDAVIYFAYLSTTNIHVVVPTKMDFHVNEQTNGMIAAGTSNQSNGQYEMQNHSDYPVEVSLKEVKETENAGLTFLDAAADPTDSKDPIRLDLLHSTNLPDNRFTESIIGVNASTPETSLGILDGQHVAHESPPSSIGRFTLGGEYFGNLTTAGKEPTLVFSFTFTVLID